MFADQIAIVTGAASGIGAATAHLMARRGAHVVLVDRNEEEIERTAATIRQMSIPPTPSANKFGESGPGSGTPNRLAWLSVSIILMK